MAKKDSEEVKVEVKQPEVFDPDIERHNTTEYLQHNFNPEEIIEKGAAMAKAINELQSARDQLRAVTKKFQGRVAEVESEIRKLANDMNTGYEMREIDCVQVRNYRTMMISVSRLDTLDVVSERAMRPDEFQRQLPIDQEKKEAKS